MSSFADDLLILEEDLEGDDLDAFAGDFAGDFEEDFVGDLLAAIEDEDFVGDRVGFWSLSCEWRSEGVAEAGESLFSGLLSPLSGSGSREFLLSTSLVMMDLGREDLEKSLGRTITLLGDLVARRNGDTEMVRRTAISSKKLATVVGTSPGRLMDGGAVEPKIADSVWDSYAALHCAAAAEQENAGSNYSTTF